MCATNQALLLTAFTELHDGVMSQSQPFGRIRDRRRHSGGDSDDLKQQLMLLGVEPGSYGGLFAEVQKLSKRVAKLRQCLKSLKVCRTYISSHMLNISYYDVFDSAK